MTWAKLILRLLNAIVDARDEIAALEHDARHRVAESFEHSAKTLMEAWHAFEKHERPWEKVAEVEAHLGHFVGAIRGRLTAEAPIASLHDELRGAFQSPPPPSTRSRDKNIVGAVTLRPVKAEDSGDGAAHPADGISASQLGMIVHHERSTLRGASESVPNLGARNPRRGGKPPRRLTCRAAGMSVPRRSARELSP